MRRERGKQRRAAEIDEGKRTVKAKGKEAKERERQTRRDRAGKSEQKGVLARIADADAGSAGAGRMGRMSDGHAYSSTLRFIVFWRCISATSICNAALEFYAPRCSFYLRCLLFMAQQQRNGGKGAARDKQWWGKGKTAGGKCSRRRRRLLAFKLIYFQLNNFITWPTTCLI